MARELSVLLACVALALDLCVVLSPKTPRDFLPAFSARLVEMFTAGEVHLRTIHFSDLLKELQACGLVLDATSNFMAMSQLQSACAEAQVSILSLSPNQKILRRNNDIFAHEEDHLPALEATLKHFNWSSVSLLYSPDEFGTTLRRRIDELFISVQGMIARGEREDNIKNIVLREIKRKGSNIVVVGTAPEAAAPVFRTLEEGKMLREGYGFIVLGEAVWTPQQWPGLLLVKPADCAQAATLYACDADRVAATVKRISAAVSTSVQDLTADSVRNYLSLHPLSNEAVVVNTRAGTSNVVGTFDSTHTFQQVDSIYFPGNTTALPKLLLSPVEISFNSGLDNPTAAPTSIAIFSYNGQRLAISDINQRGDILPRQTLVTNDVAFGAVEWREEWAVPRILANRDRLGVAFMTGYASAVTTQTLLTFDKYNLSRPSIGSSNSLIDLGNSTQYPWFVRNGMSGLYFASLYANIMPVMGWKRCAVLYGDDGWSSSIYAKFKELADSHKIEIINNVALRKIPALATKAELRDLCTEHFLELFHCNARVVIVFILEPSPQYILELMFDLGARKGDFLFTGAWLSPNYLTSESSLSSMKHRELLEGSVGFYSTAWVGTVGEAVRQELSSRFNDTDPAFLACYFYDSVFALAYAIDNCLQFGFDYEDPHKLMKCLRETRFIGCSGFVSWLAGENNRASSDYNIFNIFRNSTTGRVSMNVVGRYSPTSTQVFDFPVPVVFADGTSVPPPDLRVVYEDCPFEEKNRHFFGDGRKLTAGVCSIVFIATAAASIVIYKKAWSIVVPVMRRSEMSTEDGIFMGTICIETFQLACLGPDFRGMNRGLMLLAQVSFVDLSDVLTFSKGVYWVALDTTFAVVGLWVVLNLFTFLHLEERLHKCEVVTFLGKLAYYFLPLLGTVCFVPILSILLDVFICEESVGPPSFLRSILLRDCFVHCWAGTHLIYVAFASVSLLVYIPSTSLLLPVWQNYQPPLHIKTFPLFMVVKLLVQVLLTCLAKTTHSTGASVAFVCILGGFIVFCLKCRTYNYARVALWQGLGLVGVLVLSVVTLVHTAVRWSSPAAFVAGVWALLVGSD